MITPTSNLSGPVLPSAVRSVEKLRSPDGGLYASAGDLFREAVFGRDSIVAASDVLVSRPRIAREIILVLARLQGTRYAEPGPGSSEEEPGRIHHEHRQRSLAGVPVSEAGIRILESLAARWGGTPDRMTYYGTADATPLYIRLIVNYCSIYGTSLLEESYLTKDGNTATIRESMREATLWVERRIAASPLGLLDFCRSNPDGIEYQTWTDGKTSLMYPSGRLLDPSLPIATSDLQALAYDALRGASILLTLSADEARRWAALALELRDRALTLLWMPDERYLALGVTLDSEGVTCQVPTISGLAAEVLDSGFLDDLEMERRRHYIHGIVDRIWGSDFLTDAGVRCLSHRHAAIIEYWQYQGAHTSWPKQTYTVVKGLRRNGFTRLARELETRLCNAVNVDADFPEFFYVDSNGEILEPTAIRSGPSQSTIVATNIPDQTQAWSASAVQAIKWGNMWRGGKVPNERSEEFEEVLLRRTDLSDFLSKDEVLRAREGRIIAWVDRDLGAEREMELLRASKLPARLWRPPVRSTAR